MAKVTVRAGSNIAFIKYWGVQDAALNLPLSNSISMTLADAHTTTTVEWQDRRDLPYDEITLDGVLLDATRAERLVRHLDRVRALADSTRRARVMSRNNFPMASGIASSASGFAALSVAATSALGCDLTPTQLSALARRGSGSASRSLFGGFVEWEAGVDDASSVAHELFAADHWALRDVVAIVNAGAKAVSSERGHSMAPTSPLNAARIASVPAALESVRTAIANRDLTLLGPVIEADALAMHAVMMTGKPSLFYWQPATLEVIHEVRRWRAEEGLAVYFTIDAGPNVHLICEAHEEAAVLERVSLLPSVQAILSSGAGAAPRFLEEHLF